MNIEKCLGTSILQNIYKRLLLSWATFYTGVSNNLSLINIVLKFSVSHPFTLHWILFHLPFLKIVTEIRHACLFLLLFSFLKPLAKLKNCVKSYWINLKQIATFTKKSQFEIGSETIKTTFNKRYDHCPEKQNKLNHHSFCSSPALHYLEFFKQYLLHSNSWISTPQKDFYKTPNNTMK